VAAYGGRLPMLVHPNFPSPELATILGAGGTKMYATAIGHDMVPGWRDHVAHTLVSRGAVLIDTDKPRWLQGAL